MKIQALFPSRLRPALQHAPLAGVLLLALALRLWDLTARALWMDEAYEYWSAIPQLAALPATVLTSYQPPLYTYVLHFWLRLGESVLWIRSLSVILSLLALLGVMLLARRHLGIGGALAAGLLVAVAPPEVRYAQEAAEYALLGCLLAVNLLALDRALEHNHWLDWLAWSASACLAVYSHYGAAIPVAATGLAALVENLRRKHWQGMLRQTLVGLAGLAGGIPLAPFLLQQLAAQNTRTVPPMLPLPQEFARLINGLGNTFLFYLSGWPFAVLPRALVLLPVAAFLLGSLVLLWQKGTPQGVRRWMIWLWASIGLYMALVRSGLYGYGEFGFRYMLVLAPLFVLAAAACLLALRQRTGVLPASLLLGGLLLLCLFSLPNRSLSERLRGTVNWPEVEDLGKVVQAWQAAGGVETPTYIYSSASLAFRYYIRQQGIETTSSLPATWYADCGRDSSLPYCHSGQMVHGMWTRDLPALEKRASLEKSFGAMPDRFWIIFSHIYPGEDQQFLDALNAEYRIKRSITRTNAAAYLLVRK